jgi:nitrite reductase/ring-hydroxylating ferredoxin subunit
MSEHHFLCKLSDIGDPASRGFNIRHGNELIEGFVVRQEGKFFAYRNSCPHTGAPLDWVEHQFLDADSALIQCAVHDARFDIASGRCVIGPCAGDSLQPLPLKIRGDQLYLELK